MATSEPDVYELYKKEVSTELNAINLFFILVFEKIGEFLKNFLELETRGTPNTERFKTVSKIMQLCASIENNIEGLHSVLTKIYMKNVEVAGFYEEATIEDYVSADFLLINFSTESTTSGYLFNTAKSSLFVPMLKACFVIRVKLKNIVAEYYRRTELYEHYFKPALGYLNEIEKEIMKMLQITL